MIFDTHARLRFRASRLERATTFSVDDLLGTLDRAYPSKAGPVPIDRAMVVADGRDTALGQDLEAHDTRLAAAVGAGDGRLVGCVTVNPMDDVARNVARLDAMIGDAGFRAVKFDPTRHGYLPHRAADLLGPILVEVARHDVPVFVHVGEPPFGFPTTVGPIIEAHPDVTFVLCNFGTQQVSYALEATYVARVNDNVLLQTSHAPLAQLRDAVTMLGPERLLFASDLPSASPAVAIAVVEALGDAPPLGLGLDRAALDLIFSENARALLDR